MTEATKLAVCLVDNYSCLHITGIRPINCAHNLSIIILSMLMTHAEKFFW